MNDIQVGARVTWRRWHLDSARAYHFSGIVRAIHVDDEGFEYAVVETDPDGHVTMPELHRLTVEAPP